MMPAGELVTVPLPVPPLVMERAKVWIVNVAVQDVAAVIVTEPVLHPVPVQPAKAEPAATVVVRVTTVPVVTVDEQLVPQVIPDLEEITTRPEAPIQAHRILGDAYTRVDRLSDALERYRFVLERAS